MQRTSFHGRPVAMMRSICGDTPRVNRLYAGDIFGLWSHVDRVRYDLIYMVSTQQRRSGDIVTSGRRQTLGASACPY